MDNFFANLKTVFQRHQFGPEAIYNIDETGLPAVLRTQRERVIASKGSKQVGKTTSTERDSLFTLYCGVNAIGNSIFPYFIFPRVNFKPYLLHDACLLHWVRWLNVSNYMDLFMELRCDTAEINTAKDLLRLKPQQQKKKQYCLWWF